MNIATFDAIVCVGAKPTSTSASRLGQPLHQDTILKACAMFGNQPYIICPYATIYVYIYIYTRVCVFSYLFIYLYLYTLFIYLFIYLY